MRKKEFYLDNAATTPLAPEVLVAMLPYMTTEYGNASTIYGPGIRAREAVEEARRSVATLLCCTDPSSIVFTSGGTEADNMALFYALSARKDVAHPRIITSAIEHPAIINTCKRLEAFGVDVQYVKPDPNGHINPADIERLIDVNTVLISIMYANNETGIIQPVEKISKIAAMHGIFFHTDAVQAVGHMDIGVDEIPGISMLSASAHKFNGPKGVGFLYIDQQDEALKKGSPFITGGHQEAGLRAGTENVAGIVGLGAAAKLASDAEYWERQSLIRATKHTFMLRLREAIQGIRMNGRGDRVPGTVNIQMPFGLASQWQELLGERGIYVGTGSACSSHEDKPSYVLTAMGLTADEARRSLRFSFGNHLDSREISFLVEQIKEVGNAIKEFGAD